MKLKKLPLACLAAGLLFASCDKDEVSTPPQEVVNEKAPAETKLSKDVLDKVAALNLNSDYVEEFEMELPGGETQSTYLIENDIAISAEQLEELSDANITTKQYRTYNLVSSPRTIRIVGYTGTGNGQDLSNKMRQALQGAVNNYNALNIGLRFTLTFSADFSSSDIVVFKVSNGQVGGVAGFPTNGNPYQFVQIYSGMEQYSTATNQHVMAHEIGHTLGMRHTDWFSRQSCGQGSGETAGSSGAVHIPGTPRGYDSESIMLSCFSANESGNFGYYDTVAFEYLY